MFWVICYFCHIPGDEGLKKKRHVLSFLNTLPSLSVHGCAYLWLLLMGATARHSFQSFSESVLGDSIALGAGDKNEQDRQGAYSQGTFSRLETALNKDSIWLIIRIHRFCKNEVSGEIPELISFNNCTNSIHKQVCHEDMKNRTLYKSFHLSVMGTFPTGNYNLYIKTKHRLVYMVGLFFLMIWVYVFNATENCTQEHLLYKYTDIPYTFICLKWLYFLYVGMYMTYVFMHFVCVCVYVRRPEIDTGYVPLVLTLIFETLLITEYRVQLQMRLTSQ